MFWKKESKKDPIKWEVLNELSQLEQIKEESKKQPILIYKHSSRCGISSMTMDRLERSWKEELNFIKTYYLDLISFRALSDAIANEFQVYHESPQVILLQNQEVVYHDSHMSISVDTIEKIAKPANQND